MWLELLPQPRGQTTLVGGTIRLLDQVRDQVTVRVFGGRDMVVLFDDRTHFFRDGVAAAPATCKSAHEFTWIRPWPGPAYLRAASAS